MYVSLRACLGFGVGVGVGVGGSSGRVEKGNWYLTLDYDDRIMIILRQMLRLQSVRRFAVKSEANSQDGAKMSLL
jgi:hypothetical protein